MSTKKRNLDTYLAEVFKHFIAIKDEDYKKSQEVFDCVFKQVKAKMSEKCNYFGKYGSQIMYAGSVYDGIKVSKLDEFDMDIVIRLPINYDDGIIIENDRPGYLKLKIDAFDHLDKQQGWEKCHVVTRSWRDSEKYFLQNEFRFWMHGVVQRALNELKGQVTVNGLTYLVKLGKQSGPAQTLFIQNTKGNEPFKLDVDLVPVIRFMHPRWPEGYRCVEEAQVKEWLVVPKPNKALEESTQNRCWRLSFQEFEREMMKGCQQLKTTIRLLKKLRDSLELKDIASYYIKTLFLWKVDENKGEGEERELTKKKYWQKPLSVLFKEMVEVLYNAIKEKKIRYFWHEDNNLIENLKPTVQAIYVEKLKNVLDAINSNDVDKVASYLLTVGEFQEFKKLDFYQKQMEQQQKLVELQQKQLLSSSQNSLSRQESGVSVTSSDSSRDATDSPSQDATVVDLVRSLHDKVSTMVEDQKRLKKIEVDTKNSTTKLNSAVDMLKDINVKLDEHNDKLKKLEISFTEENNLLKDRIDMLMDKLDDQNERLQRLERANKKFMNDDGLSMGLEIDHKSIRLTE